MPHLGYVPYARAIACNVSNAKQTSNALAQRASSGQEGAVHKQINANKTARLFFTAHAKTKRPLNSGCHAQLVN